MIGRLNVVSYQIKMSLERKILGKVNESDLGRLKLLKLSETFFNIQIVMI